MWLHATIAGPVAGMCSSPSYRSRNQARTGGIATPFARWYQGSASAQSSSSRARPSTDQTAGRNPAAASSFRVSPITNGYSPSASP